MELKLFDVHAHYQDERFDGDRDELFEKMRADGVRGIVDSGDSAESSVKCIKTAEKYDFVYAAAGIHPLNVKYAKDGDIDKIRELLKHPKVVAVGEIVLDYHYEDTAPKEQQFYWLREQIKLAAETGKPIVFHDRDAHEDSFNVLKEASKMGVGGILHCFSGSVEMMREIIKIGFSISLGGAVTFKNARKTAEVAREVPLDRLLLETDCPYLSPEPFRGKRNYSSLIKYTAQKIADIKGISVEELCDVVYKNSIKIFGIS